MHLPVIRTQFTVVDQDGVRLGGTHWLDLDLVENVSHLSHHSGRLCEKCIWFDSPRFLSSFALRLVVFDQLLVGDHEPLEPVHEALQRIGPVPLRAVLAVNVVVLHEELDDGLLCDPNCVYVLFAVTPIRTQRAEIRQSRISGVTYSLSDLSSRDVMKSWP